jgi:zinc protease
VLASLDAGAEHENTAVAGLAALTSASLLEGTADETADVLAARCELLGGEMEAEASWANATCGLTVLESSLSGAVRVISDVINTPLLPAAGIIRLRAERLAELVLQEAEPRGLADQRFLRAVFPEARYGLSFAGDALRVSTLEPDAVKDFHRRMYAPHNTTLLIVGDVDPESLVRECAEVFGYARPSAPHQTNPASLTGGGKPPRRVVGVVRPRAPQSEIRIGHASVARGHEDFHAITVMNAILGGLFNSRINMNLREARGYTYGAFSAMDWRRAASLFEVSTAVRSDVTVAAITEILGEIDRIRDSLVSPQELSLATEYLTGVFPIRFETTEAIAAAISTRESYRLPPAYFDEYRDRIASVSSSDVLRVAQTHLRPGQLQLVVVGDIPSFESELDRLGERTPC